MLTRFVRIQLIVFSVASLIGFAMLSSYLQVPTLLGIGKISVRLELPAAGGLYPFANVTYRGKQIGTVRSVRLTATGAEALLSLDDQPRIPADLTAEVRSISAIGEQYVDLMPRNASAPFLDNGAVIPLTATKIPQPVGPMLDKLSALLESVPEEKLRTLVDETYTAFDGANYDLGSLLDSSATITSAMDATADQTRTLIDDAQPVLDAQARSADATRTWARALAGVTAQLAANDTQLRTIVESGPAAAQEITALLTSIKPTLPVLLSNMTALGQTAVTYLPGLRQLMVLLPPATAFYQASRGVNNATGIPIGDFRIQISDPAACTVGFLPPSQWRSPNETTTLDTPDDMYCKLPQDSPLGVRGVRNIPCMGQPGKRAPTVEICDSAEPYRPIAMRQHTLGPYPFDPNLISQGISPDGRVPDQVEPHIFAPVEGTPPPAGLPHDEPSAPVIPTPPAGTDDGAAPTDPPANEYDPPTTQSEPDPPNPAQTGVSPDFTPNAWLQSSPGAAVAIAEYDPQTGRYLAPDGTAYQQSDLVHSPATWKDLVLPPGIPRQG